MPLHKTQGFGVKFLWGFWKGKCREGITIRYLWTWKWLEFFKHWFYMNVRDWRAKRARKKYTNKVNTTLALDPFSYIVLYSYQSNLHTGPPLWQISGGIPTQGPPPLDPPLFRPLAACRCILYLLMHGILIIGTHHVTVGETINPLCI